MSVDHWICEGIGISTNQLLERIDKDKCINFLRELKPMEEIEEDNFDLNDYIQESSFDGVGELLCCCDDSKVMSYANNNDNECYFLYCRTYPWEHSENEPKSIDEVHKIIIRAVQKITSLPESEIEGMIDDEIYEYGCG